MKKYDKLEIKGFERTAPDTVQVIMECDGSCFDRNYPVRVPASYKASKKNFYRHGDGEPHLIKKIRQQKIKDEVRDKAFVEKARTANKEAEDIGDIDHAITELNNDFTGYTIE